MGAQIAAHCVNAGVPVVLYDLSTPEGATQESATPDGTAGVGDRSGIARKAIAQLKKLNPAPLGRPDLADLIEPANYEQDLAKLADCDLVIEAIAERLDWKRDLYHKLAPALRPDA